MSMDLTRAVMQRSQSLGPGRAVLLVLALSTNDKRGGVAWPSVPTLAQYCGLTVRTVHRAVKELERIGELSVKRAARHVRTAGGKQPVNVYTVQLPVDDTAASDSPPLSGPSSRERALERARREQQVRKFGPPPTSSEQREYEARRRRRGVTP